VTISNHVRQMVKSVRSRFALQPLQQRMLPSDEDFTTLRPVRRATRQSIARYWARLMSDETASAQDRDALLDEVTAENAADFSAPKQRLSRLTRAGHMLRRNQAASAPQCFTKG